MKLKRRVMALALAGAVTGGIGLATAPAASATTNLKEVYWCNPADSDTIWHRAKCDGWWAVGVNSRDFNIYADAKTRYSDGYNVTDLHWVYSSSGRRRDINVYCRYQDNHLSGVVKVVTIGGGLSNSYDFDNGNTPFHPCDGVNKGFYFTVKDTATGLSSFFDVNTSYSGALHHRGSEWYN